MRRIRGFDLRRIPHLVAPVHYPLLLQEAEGLEAIAWDGSHEIEAVAVRLRELDADHVLTIVATPSARDRGDDERLLEWLVDDATTAGRTLVVEFTEAPDATNPIRRLLERVRMPTPQASRLMVVFGPTMYRATLSEEAALDRQHPIGSWRPLPSSCRIVGWMDCSEQQRSMLRSSLETLDVYREIDPFSRESGCEARTSLAILKDQTIVGWLLSHSQPDGTLRQTVSYIDPRLQRLGLIYPAYVELIRRIVAELGMDTKMRFTVDLIQARGLARVVRRRWAPFADSVQTCWKSTRIASSR